MKILIRVVAFIALMMWCLLVGWPGAIIWLISNFLFGFNDPRPDKIFNWFQKSGEPLMNLVFET